MLAQLGKQNGVDAHDLGLGSSPSCYAALVRDDNHRSIQPLGGDRRVHCNVEWFELIRRDHVAVDYTSVQYAIPVEE